jgi:hypothetical protein
MAFSRPKASTTQRGYGAAHDRAKRAAHAELNRAGSGVCAELVCLMPSRLILPGMRLDLAHTPDRTAYLGLAHARCNRRDGARRGRARQTTTARRM